MSEKSMQSLKPGLAVFALILATPSAADPLLSIDITLADGEDYAAAIKVVKKAGADATSLSLFWDDLETEPGVYAPKDNWPTIANLYFPSTGLAYTLTFSVIDTVVDRRPADLRGLAWDDPLVINRFNAHADAVLARLPRVHFKAIAIGNEVDAFLTTPANVAAYARFLIAVRAHLAIMRPGVPVAAKLTFTGLTADAARLAPILQAGDAAFFTYYPLNPDFTLRPPTDATHDLDVMLDLAAGKPLWLLESGYPSNGCGAPVGGQEAFFKTLLAAVALHKDAIALVSATYLTDLPDAVVDGFSDYYGFGGDCFARYLDSLGLRQYDGTAKPALAALVH
jgi:hypothetical protein